VFELDKFKSIISPHVCNAGGDAAVAFANGYGTYIKAAILKRADAAPAESSPATAPAHAADHAAKSNAPPEPQTPKNACVPGTTQTCVGPGACAGGQACRPDGQGYTDCDCG
jgi:hypothetical protein